MMTISMGHIPVRRPIREAMDAVTEQGGNENLEGMQIMIRALRRDSVEDEENFSIICEKGCQRQKKMR